MSVLPLINRVASFVVTLPVGPILVNPPQTQVPGANPLRVVFEVTRGTSGREPARAKITAVNMKPAKRKVIVAGSKRIDDTTLPPLVAAGIQPLPDGTLFDAAAAMARVTLTAGYAAIRSIIFDGTILRAVEERSGPDWNLTIEAGDAAAATALVSLRRTFPPGATGLDLISSLAIACSTPLAYAPPELASAVYVSGYVPGPRARDDLFALLDATGSDLIGAPAFDWWIDQGLLWIVGKGQVLPLPPIAITDVPAPAGSFLLLERARQAEGFRCELTTQLIPALVPGQAITVLSQDVRGTYRVEHLTHSGDLASDTWQTKIIASPIVG